MMLVTHGSFISMYIMSHPQSQTANVIKPQSCTSLYDNMISPLVCLGFILYFSATAVRKRRCVCLTVTDCSENQINWKWDKII